MWSDGEKTECWPQNLCTLEYHIIINNPFQEDNKMQLYDNYDNFGYNIDEYDFDAREYNDDVNDESFQFHASGLYPILPTTYLLNLLKQVHTNIISFVENTKYVDKISQLQTSCKEVR